MRRELASLSELDTFASEIIAITVPKTRIYLSGDLGTGKTAFAKAFIQQAGFDGNVTSPTYAIMQDYVTSRWNIIHCDLYRLSHLDEVDEIGLFELADEDNAVLLLEWPEKIVGLPKADIHISFFLTGGARYVEWCRP